MKSVKNQFWYKVTTQMNQKMNQIGKQVTYKVQDQVENQLWHQVWFQVWDELLIPVNDQVLIQVESSHEIRQK